jgi:hypothetical protein
MAEMANEGEPNCRGKSWRPNGVPCKNFTSTFVIDLESARKRLRTKRLDVPRIVRLLDQAVQFQSQLSSGKDRFRADVAAANGLSAVRVSQLLVLLKLAPSLVTFIRSLPEGTPARTVTERSLRGLTRLPQREQVSEARRLLSGFARLLASGPAVSS